MFVLPPQPCRRILAVVLCVAVIAYGALPCWADTATNNGTIPGDWDGTVNDDLYTNNGTIGGLWNMSQGGSDVLVNTGSVTGPTFCGAGDDTVEAVGGAVFNNVVFGGGGDDTLILTGVDSTSGVFVGGIASFEYGKITPNGTTKIDADIEFTDQTDIYGGTVRISAELDSDSVVVHNNGTLEITSTGSVLGDIDSDTSGMTFSLANGAGVAGWVYSLGPSNISIDGVVLDDVLGNYYGTGDTTVQIGENGIIAGSVGGLVAGTGDAYINNAGHIVGVLVGSDSSIGDVTIENSGVVEMLLVGIASAETPTLGQGSATLTNTATGEVGIAFCGNWGANGDVTITNNGTVYGDFMGMMEGWGNVTATNNGLVGGDFVGVEGGVGNATLSNTNAVDGGYYGIFGGTGTVYMVNTGDVGDVMVGADRNTGNVTIINHGEILYDMCGQSDGTGDVYLVNTGTVATGNAFVSHLYGIWGGTGNVTLINSGTVGGNLYGNLDGTGNCTITNSGTVAGHLIAGSGNDSVTLTETSSIGGNVDGGNGNDTLVFDVATSLAINDTSPYINFENLGFNGSGTTTLSDAFNVSGGVEVNGTLTVASSGSIQSGSLDINSINSLNINGTVNVSGETSVDGTLNVNIGGNLTSGSMTVSSGNTANISGTTGITELTSVSGALNVNSGGTLTSGIMSVSSGGTANISGTTGVTDLTGVSGTLNVNSGGSLTSGSISVSSGGTANISGTTGVTDLTSVSGTLNVNSGGSLGSGSLSVSGKTVVDGQASIGTATTVTGSLYVNGSLGTGTLNIGGYGNISGYASSAATSVSGELIVNGILSSSVVNIASGGVVSGNGTINGNLINAGAVAPGNSIGTLVVTGNFTNQAGGSYYCEANANGQSDQIIAGTVTLNGGTLVTALPVGLYTSGTCWTVINATGGISGNFDNVTNLNNSAILNLETVINGGTVELEIVRTPFTSIAANKTQQQVASALDAVVPLAQSQDDDISNLLLKMDWQYDQDQIDRALSALAPSIYDAFGGASHNAAKMFGQAMGDRIDNLRLRRGFGLGGPEKSEGPLLAMAEEHQAAGVLAGGGASRDWSVWARAMGDWSDTSASGSKLGYDTNTGGAVFGADGSVLPWLTTGLVVGYSTTDINWSAGSHSGEQTGMHYGAYASAQRGGFYGDAALAYATYNNDAQRAIEFDDVGATAKADFDSSIWSFSLGGGYDQHSGNITWGPALSFAYADYQQDGFSENGAGGLGLNVLELDQNTWNSSLGLRAAGLWMAGSVNIMPKAGFYWLHNFDDDARVIKATFRDYGSSTPMNVAGLDPFGDALVANLGVSAVMAGRLSAFVDYSYLYCTDYNGHTITAGLDWMF